MGQKLNPAQSICEFHVSSDCPQREPGGWRAPIPPAALAGLRWAGDRRPPPYTHLSAPGSPDEDALVVIVLPQAAVALVGDGEDVRRELAQMAPAVQLHGGTLVQAGDGLIGVHGGDDGADVGLQAEGKGRAALPGER